MDIPFSQENFGGEFGGNRDPEYLAVNPNGVVPTLIDEGNAIWESNTILRYLCNSRGPTSLYPQDPIDRAMVERWMDWHLAALNKFMSQLYIGIVKTPEAERDLQALDRARMESQRCFALLDDALAQNSYLAGDAFSLADIPCGIMVYRWIALGFARDSEQPNLRRWADRLAERHAYRKNVMVGLG
ncbi:hypothetical protein V473_12035 [Sphingobium cupriresistens LL01]|uniref:Glutathione S-transferase n=1 Tax=Sphingobium cupriresistens LL01 TaxID=1420583 RepID=A0A0J7XHJ8_9SPHN|nr:hypothetical protein V473_12035 [Sphingobium cupriresistens LL01]